MGKKSPSHPRIRQIRETLINFNGESQLEQAVSLVEDITGDAEIPGYWRAYAAYKGVSIAYGFELDDNKRDEWMAKGKIALKEVLLRDDEFYALSALITCLRLRDSSVVKAPLMSLNIQNMINRAWRLSKTNPRVYYAAGFYSYYRPEKYGGGKDVITNLNQAIRLFENKKNDYPWWGHSESWSLLIKYLFRINQQEKAIEMLQKAVSIFPENRPFISALKKVEVAHGV